MIIETVIIINNNISLGYVLRWGNKDYNKDAYNGVWVIMGDKNHEHSDSQS